MPAYAIIEILEIKDNAAYGEYVEKVFSIVEKYRGRYLIRGGTITPLSGNWDPDRVIVIEFPSLADLRACFGAPEYKKIAPLREASTVSKSIAVEGYPGVVKHPL